MVLGSRLLFGALVDRCQARGFAPMCILKSTVATKPRVVALLPHTEQDPEQPSVFGFHVIFLPFLNDVRKFVYGDLIGWTPVMKENRKHVSEIWRADKDQIDAAEAIV